MNRQILAAATLAALFAAGIANAAIRPAQDAERERPPAPRKEHRQEARAGRAGQQAPQARQPQHRQSGGERRETAQGKREDHRGWRQDQRDAPRNEQRNDRRDRQQDRRDDQRQAHQEHRDDRRDRQQDRRNDRRDWRQDQRRVGYARYRQDYDRRVRDFHVRIAPRYYVRPAQYRYSYGGIWYTTSNYGADVLRQAVDWGYQEGLRAGRADRYDGWPADYRDSVAWRNGGFGYGGRYVSRADYDYYFRQGFQRGYDDGYSGRMRYGRHVDDHVVIAEAVIAAILGLQLLR